MVTMPSARFFVAVVGHTSMQGGSSQCWQPVGTNARCTSGYTPNSMSSTRRHCTPGGVALACLHEAVQVWQPTQRSQIGDHGPARHARCSIAMARTERLRGRRTRLPAASDPTRTMSAPEPVASVSVDRHRRQRCSGSARRSPWRTASPSGRTGRSAAACRAGCPGAAPRGRARCAAASRSRPGRRRRCRAARAACVLMITPRWPGDVVGDFLDQLHADVAAPGILHAARGQQPERIVRRLAARHR